MRILFAFIGILFDLVIMAAACVAIYCAVQPDTFLLLLQQLGENGDKLMATYAGRIQVGSVGLIALILSFRGIFLLMFSSPEKDFTIQTGDSGSLSVSRGTVGRVISQLAEQMSPAAQIRSLAITQRDDGLKVSFRIELDLTKCNLKEYTAELTDAIKSYFDNSLGIKIARLDISAAAAEGSSPAALPVPVEKVQEQEPENKTDQ